MNKNANLISSPIQSSVIFVYVILGCYAKKKKHFKKRKVKDLWSKAHGFFCEAVAKGGEGSAFIRNSLNRKREFTNFSNGYSSHIHWLTFGPTDFCISLLDWWFWFTAVSALLYCKENSILRWLEINWVSHRFRPVLSAVARKTFGFLVYYRYFCFIPPGDFIALNPLFLYPLSCLHAWAFHAIMRQTEHDYCYGNQGKTIPSSPIYGLISKTSACFNGSFDL